MGGWSTCYASSAGANVTYKIGFKLPAALTLPAASGFSVCVWYNSQSPSNAATNWGRVWALETAYNQNSLFLAQKQSYSSAGVGDSQGRYAAFQYQMSANVWTHLCTVYTSSSATPSASSMCAFVTYVNGVAFSNTPETTYPANTPPYTSFSLQTPQTALNLSGSWLMGEKDSPYYWTGYIDELCLYNRALSQAEVTAVYQFSGDSHVPLLVLAWPA